MTSDQPAEVLARWREDDDPGVPADLRELLDALEV